MNIIYREPGDVIQLEARRACEFMGMRFRKGNILVIQLAVPFGEPTDNNGTGNGPWPWGLSNDDLCTLALDAWRAPED